MTETANLGTGRKVAVFLVASFGGLSVLLFAWLRGFVSSTVLNGLLLLATVVGITSIILQTSYPQLFGHYGRMFYHVAGGPLFAYVASFSRESALVLALALLTAFGSLALLEHFGVSSLFSGTKTHHVVNGRIVNGPTHYQSGTYWAMGALVALIFFELTAAVAAILILAVGDGAAGLAGDLLRGRRSASCAKTAEGSIAFFCTASIVSSLYVAPLVAIVASAVGTIAEALPLSLDDNIRVPLATAITITVLRNLLIL
jgi:dolichol kinase